MPLDSGNCLAHSGAEPCHHQMMLSCWVIGQRCNPASRYTTAILWCSCCQRHFSASVEHMAAPRASLIPSLALLLESVLCSNGPTNTRTKKHKHKSYTGYLLNISSGSQEKSTHVNKQTNNTRKRSLRQTKPHTVSLSLLHTLSVFTHSYYQTCLFAPCSVLAGVREHKGPF